MIETKVHDLTRSEYNEGSCLEIKGISVSYGDRPAVFSASASIANGTMTAIIGPNGAGKSTLLKAALGIVPKLSGSASFFGPPPTGCLCSAASKR